MTCTGGRTVDPTLTSFRHEHESEALLKLSTYEELIANGDVRCTSSEEVIELRQRAGSAGLETTTIELEDSFYELVEITPPPVPAERRSAIASIASALLREANWRGHSLVRWRQVGGRFAGACERGARLWAESNLDPPLIDGIELLGTDCRRPGARKWRRIQRKEHRRRERAAAKRRDRRRARSGRRRSVADGRDLPTAGRRRRPGIRAQSRARGLSTAQVHAREQSVRFKAQTRTPLTELPCQLLVPAVELLVAPFGRTSSPQCCSISASGGNQSGHQTPGSSGQKVLGRSRAAS